MEVNEIFQYRVAYWKDTETHTPLINRHSSSKVYHNKNHFVIASVVKVKKEAWPDSGFDDEVKI